MSGSRIRGHHGVEPWVMRPDYATYKSPYGPKYKIQPNFHGISAGRAFKFGVTTAGFGAAAGIFAVFFFGDVPRVREDILTKLPVIGDYFVKEIPPEDNPF